MDQRIDIDWTSCQGHGLCAELLPEHITLDEWGYPLVAGTPLPSHTVKRARRAAADCPVLALKLTAGQAPLQGRGAVSISGFAAGRDKPRPTRSPKSTAPPEPVRP